MDLPPPRGPDRAGTHDGLAYAVWLPDRIGAEDTRGEPSRRVPQPPWPGVVILHGAGSRKENHADFARLAAANGWAALSYDQRGHGETERPMEPGALDDVSKVARLLAAQDGVDASRVALRGSSMGGFMAINAAASDPWIAGAIAICPAAAGDLARGLRQGKYEMRVGDATSLELWLTQTELGPAVERIAGRPLFLMHAEGDEQVPSWQTEDLFELASEPKRLLIAPGGTHRSLQHDAELQTVALRWLESKLRG